MNKSIGGIIKLNRIQKNLSLKAFNHIEGMSEPLLSRVERGNEKISQEKIASIFHYMEIEVIGEDIDDEFEKEFLQFYHDVVYMLDYEASYEVLLSYSDVIQSTCSYIKYLLALMIHNVVIGDYSDITQYQCIEEYFDYLEDYQRQIYCDNMGVLYKENYNKEKAIDYYEKALTYKGIELSKGMVNYHYSIGLSYNGEIYKAIEVAMIAKDIFAKTVNLKRLSVISFQIASIYSNCGRYQEAEDLFRYCISAVKLLNMNKQLESIYNDLFWHYLKSKQYLKILEQKDEILLYHPKECIYFYVAFAYHKMGNEEKSIEYICYANDKIDKYTQPVTKVLIQSFYIYLTSNSANKIEKALLHAYGKAKQSNDIESIVFVKEQLIDFYKETNQIEKYYQCLENLLKIK